MGDIFGEDFRDFLRALKSHKVDFVLIGDYAVIIRGYHRTTGDLDIFVRTSKANYHNLERAFTDFGMSTFNMTLESFLDSDNEVFTFGRSPVSIDILTSVKGLIFSEGKEYSSIVDVEGLIIPVLTKDGLIKAKKAADRPKDQQDIQELLSLEEE